jgi:hypothetical protein
MPGYQRILLHFGSRDEDLPAARIKPGGSASALSLIPDRYEEGATGKGRSAKNLVTNLTTDSQESSGF